MYDFFWCLKSFQTTTCLSISILNMQLVTFSPWFILPGCQPNFASVYLLDTNNDWVPVRLRARFPKRQFGAGINYLSWLHTTNLPQPNHDHDWNYIWQFTSPWRAWGEHSYRPSPEGHSSSSICWGGSFYLCQETFCKACIGRDFLFFFLDFLVCRCMAAAFS